MKKYIIHVIISAILLIGLVSCHSKNKQPNNSDIKDTNVFVPSVYDKPEGPYQDYQYAIVYLNISVDNHPYRDYMDALWINADLDNENWNYDDYSKRTHLPTIYLVYNSKEALLLDFDRIKEIAYLTETLSIYLHTVDKKLDVTLESKVEDLITLMTYYDGSEIEVEQLPFKQLYLSTNVALVMGYIVLDSFDAYIGFDKENILELDEAFFIKKSVVFVGKDRSGSLEIRGVDKVFVNEDGLLEIAMNGYSHSEHFTEDIQYWTVAIGIDKYILEDHDEIVIHHHITFGNGYLSDVPFHNSKDISN